MNSPVEAAAAYAAFYGAMTPEALDGLERIFTPDARFLDPFNDARGVAEIAGVFRHMYAHTEGPRFQVHDYQADGDTAYYHWTFTARVRGKALAIRGLSRVLFAADGRVREHRDYWDPASQLYGRLPLLGGLCRWLAGRFSASRVPSADP